MLWIDVERLVKKILMQEFRDYDLSLLGESYLVYDKCIKNFDETKNPNFITYFAQALRYHLTDYLVSDTVIYVPVKKRSVNKLSYISTSSKITNDDSSISTFEDFMESDIETDADSSYNELLHIIKNDVKLTDIEKTCVDWFLSNEEFPREHRTNMYHAKKKIAEKLKLLGY